MSWQLVFAKHAQKDAKKLSAAGLKAKAQELLAKILEGFPHPETNDWHDLAVLAEEALSRHAEYKIEYEWVLMCHRLVIANQFHFSKAELLLADIALLQHEHCVVVDIRWELPKILPRLIQIETIGQRRALLAAGKVFAGNNGTAQLVGNLFRQIKILDDTTHVGSSIPV